MSHEGDQDGQCTLSCPEHPFWWRVKGQASTLSSKLLEKETPMLSSAVWVPRAQEQCLPLYPPAQSRAQYVLVAQMRERKSKAERMWMDDRWVGGWIDEWMING